MRLIGKSFKVVCMKIIWRNGETNIFYTFAIIRMESQVYDVPHLYKISLIQEFLRKLFTEAKYSNMLKFRFR